MNLISKNLKKREHSDLTLLYVVTIDFFTWKLYIGLLKIFFLIK